MGQGRKTSPLGQTPWPTLLRLPRSSGEEGEEGRAQRRRLPAAPRSPRSSRSPPLLPPPARGGRDRAAAGPSARPGAAPRRPDAPCAGRARVNAPAPRQRGRVGL